MLKLEINEKASVCLGRIVYMVVEDKSVKDTELFSFDNWKNYVAEVNAKFTETDKEFVTVEVNEDKKTTTVQVHKDVDVFINEHIDVLRLHLSRLVTDVRFSIKQKKRIEGSLETKSSTEGKSFINKLKFWGDD